MTEPSVPSFGETVRLPKTPQKPRLSQGQIIVAFYAVLALAALGIGWLRDAPNLLSFGGTARPLGAHLGSLAAGTLLGVLLVRASRWSVLRFAWARVLHREFRVVVRGLSDGEIWLLALSSSIAEELFFRGALQGAIGFLPAAVLFGLLHAGPGKSFRIWTLFALAGGLALGALEALRGTLGGAIVGHLLVNGVNLVRLARRGSAVFAAAPRAEGGPPADG